MSVSKGLSTEIKRYIDEAIAEALKTQESQEAKKNVVDFDIVVTSKLAKVDVAATDYVEGDKKYFTFDEALEVQEKLKDTGWRLPTRSEWVLLCEEFGQKDNQLDSEILQKNLRLEKLGWEDGRGMTYSVGEEGNYWSSRPYSSVTNSCGLYFNASDVYPSNYYYRWYGFPVRLVRDTDWGNGWQS